LKKGKKGAADQTLSTEHEQSETPEGIFEGDEEFYFEDLQHQVADFEKRIERQEELVWKLEFRLTEVEKKLKESEANVEKLKAAAAKKRSKEKSP